MIAFEFCEHPPGANAARYISVTLFSGPDRRYRASWQMRNEEWQFLLSLLKPSIRLEVKEVDRDSVVYGDKP